jgi:uroporphyrinogen decarboxylase
MKPRERVITALNHKIPDRVPTAFWGGPYGMVDALYHQVRDLLDLGEPVPPFRSGHTINYLDDRVLEKLGTDTRYVWPGASPISPQQPTNDPNRFLDALGQVWIQTFPYFSAGPGLLEDAKEVAEIEELVEWPDTAHPNWTRGVAERAKALAEEGEYFVIGRMVVGHGPFQLASDLRGTSNFMMDMALNPDFATALLGRVTDMISGLIAGYLKAADGHLDMIELPGDDYASNLNLIISPAMFRQLIKPCIAKMVAVIREIQPDIKIMLHSDGAINKLIPDFIELGIDVLHPLEPVEGMDVAAVKREFGSQIAFIGGVDITHAMPGTVEDVRKDVKRCIETLAPGGGYVLSPCNHLQADVPAENVLELFRYAKEIGNY